MNQRDQEIEKTILKKIETAEINPFTDFFKGHLYDRLEDISQKILGNNKAWTNASNRYSKYFDQIRNLVPEDGKKLLFDMDSCLGTMDAEQQEVFYKQGFSDGLEMKNYLLTPGPSYSEPSPEPDVIDWIDSIEIPEKLATKYDSVDVFYMRPLEKHPKLTITYKDNNALFIGFTSDMTPEEMQERIKEID